MLVGFLLLVLGLGYLSDPKAILRFNATMRDYFFKDAHVLLHGRRIGVLLLVVGFLLLLLGYNSPFK